MEMILNIIYWIFVVTFVGIFLFLMLPTLIKTYLVKHAFKREKRKIPQVIKSFDNAKTGRELGSGVSELIKFGFIQCQKAGNHAKSFPDWRQRESFFRYANPEMVKTIREVGNYYEKYII